MYNNEIWKDIPEYNGFYQVSNLGRIRSLDRITIHSSGAAMKRKGKILKPLLFGTTRRKYFSVVLQFK